MPSLLDLGVFQAINISLLSVTESDLISVKPGRPLPEKAVVIGEMDDALKALLFLHRQKVKEFQRSISNLKVNYTCAGASEFVAAANEAIGSLELATDYDLWFWRSVAFEYDLDEDALGRCGYDQDFKFYLSP